jgi:hypothetical protein
MTPLQGMTAIGIIAGVVGLGVVNGLVNYASSNNDKPKTEKVVVEVPGPKGNSGPQGEKGSQGSQGPIGETGPQGPQGIQGLPGSPGEAGASGLQGLPGDIGAQGPSGANGEIGLPGPKGIQGDVGPQGETGLTGPQGPQGETGLTGSQGPQGDIGPQGPQGIPGPSATIVWGSVDNFGQTISGSGFTAVRLGIGRYQINFTTPFSVIPTLVVTKVFGSISVDAGTIVQPRENAIVDEVLVNTAIIATSNTLGQLADSSFNFIALATP